VIRLTIPTIEDDDLQAVREALASGYLVQGPRVAAFEKQVATYIGAATAVAVSNGTAALHLALLALGIGPGDIVIVTAYSWLSTANVIELVGAETVFVDIDRKTFNIDPAKLEARTAELMSDAETAKRVKAIMVVHTFGQVADMTAIMETANRFQIPVIEDAACALGARANNSQAGSWGVLGCFSFHPRKAITTGEGGLVTTNDASLARRLRALRNHGQDPDSPSPDFIMPGLNYRLTEFQAALGITQMSKLDRILAARKQLVQNYDRLLRDTEYSVPYVPPNNDPVYQSYVITLPSALANVRGELIAELKKQGIETTLGTWHMPMTTYFKNRYGVNPGDFPVADEVFARSLSLPLYESLSESDQELVVGALVKAAENVEPKVGSLAR
jgi:perosamine synthetase